MTRLERRKLWWKVVRIRNTLLAAHEDERDAKLHARYQNTYDHFCTAVGFDKLDGKYGPKFEEGGVTWQDLILDNGEVYRWNEPL